jgi:glutamate formiminotransferase/formiminotetrahydrofolate cyclodeaminase
LLADDEARQNHLFARAENVAMKRLIECVPNFSEGRDPAKVDALVAAMRAVPGVYVLDSEMDADHNRSVITLAGEPEAVAEAALAGVGKALELIDLTKHSGAHPRVGAADVVPFVPVEGVELEDCVVLAKKVGREIWERYKIPVYFYEAAAERPERSNLENIRKGQFEGLREEAPRNPDRAPDVGGPGLHPTAGATVVGARKFLIAYNINLNTPDVEIAKKIAKALRFSTGGLRHAKAMGVDLRARGLAQVSINLTDFEQTPIHRAFELVKREAERYGAAIVGSEIVGLVPNRAIEMTADFYLQLENFSPEQVLENRVAAALSGAPLESKGKWSAMARPFLEATAAATATPGGGSVAALAGALAASLGQMVAGLSRKKKSQAAHAEALSEAWEAMRAAADALADAIDRDAASYDAVLAAMRLPRSTPEELARRDAAIEEATRGAAEVPIEVAERAADLFERLGQLEAISSPSMISDLRVGRLLAAAAARGALENVAINLEGLRDAEFAGRMRARSAAVEARISASPVIAG